MYSSVLIIITYYTSYSFQLSDLVMLGHCHIQKNEAIFFWATISFRNIESINRNTEWSCIVHLFTVGQKMQTVTTYVKQIQKK